MKVFEISSRKTRNGKRKFKLILHKIYPDSCVDEVNEVGTEYNLNGITWIREFCENALPSIKGMSLRCEFLDEDRTELHGHGYTDKADGNPIFENAVQIGTFTNGYIDEVEDENGEMITVCIGEGEIDALCYHNFVEKLDADIANGIYPNGSVEILHTDDNESIIYKYGYKSQGRIPMDFIYSGYALLGITPADSSAKLIELNEHKEELVEMNEDQVKAVVEQTINMISEHNSEMEQCRQECADKIAEANAAVETATNEKNEVEASVATLQEALDQIKAEYKELDEKYNTLWEEKKVLEKALGEAKVKERLAALNSALTEFSAEQQEYAKEQIEAFKANPLENEINTVTDAILIGIGKNAKAVADAQAAEQNSADLGDIFEEIHEPVSAETDDSIF